LNNAEFLAKIKVGVPAIWPRKPPGSPDVRWGRCRAPADHVDRRAGRHGAHSADNQDLEAWWTAHFDALGVVHSPILPAMAAWIVVFEDPDGARPRFYTRETHDPDVPPTTHPRWL